MDLKKDILVIDVGNSNIVLGLYSDSKLYHTCRIITDTEKTLDLYLNDINDIVKYSPLISFVSISSVVPIISEIFREIFTNHLRIPFLFVDASLDLGLKYLVPDPSFIGSDLIVNAYAANKIYKNSNCIIFDFGTATTGQLVGKDGCFYGTIILPGIKTALQSIIKSAAQLSEIELDKPINLLGLNTKESVLSGILNGHALMAEGFVKKIKSEYNHLSDFIVLATGGLVHLIPLDLKVFPFVDKNLTLFGLGQIGYEYANKKHPFN